MTPSDMNLDKLSKRISNYSDMIVVAKDDMPLGIALVIKTPAIAPKPQVKTSETTQTLAVKEPETPKINTPETKKLPQTPK